MKTIFTRALALVGLTALVALSAFAQTTTTPNDGAGQTGQPGTGREGRTGKHGGEGGMRGGMRGGGRQGMERRALNRLNLSEAQRGQLRDIEARYAQGFKARREEMRQLMELRRDGGTLTPEQQERAAKLRTELRESGERMHAEVLALLTPEQREELKQMREEGRARREERRQESGQKPDNDR